MKQVNNKKITPVKKQFSIKKYVESVTKKTIDYLIISTAYCDFKLNEITEDDFLDVVKEVERIYHPNEQSDLDNYLSNTLKKATPQALKDTKKSVKGFIEYSIYKDSKAGLISLETSKEAKEALTNFLAKISEAKNIDNNG